MSSRSGTSPRKPAEKDEKKLPGKAQEINMALRRAYDSAVDETIPQSMLDLLSKLD